MKAKDFRQEQDYPYNHFTKLTSTGISPDYDNIEAFAEAYHKSKVENLGIHSVIDCSTCKHQKVSKYVEPCYGCRDNDGYDNYSSAIVL